MSFLDLPFPEHWDVKKVIDLTSSSVLRVEDGNHGEYRPRPNEFTETGEVYYVKSADLVDGKVNFDKCSKINETAFHRITKGIGAPGDIIISHKGTVGTFGFINENESKLFVCSPQTTFWRTLNNNILDRNYLFAYMRSSHFLNQFMIFAGETDMAPYVSLTNQRKLQILIPPIGEQRKIVNIIKSFDDAILNCIAKIKILDKMIQLLYREWLINFKFPGHEDVKMINSGHPDFGMIPEGWEVRAVSDVASFVRGRSYTSAQLTDDDGEDFINLKCFDRGGGFRRSGLKKYLGPIKENQVINPRDSIVAVTDMTQDRAIVGRAARAPLRLSSRATFSMDLVKIVPSVDSERSWLYSYLRLSGMPDHVKHFANGANVLHLNPQLIMEYPIIWPADEIRNKFSNQYETVLDLIDNLEMQKEKLAFIRDLLLPKLFSGEIDLKAKDIQELVYQKSANKSNERTHL